MNSLPDCEALGAPLSHCCSSHSKGSDFFSELHISFLVACVAEVMLLVWQWDVFWLLPKQRRPRETPLQHILYIFYPTDAHFYALSTHFGCTAVCLVSAMHIIHQLFFFFYTLVSVYVGKWSKVILLVLHCFWPTSVKCTTRLGIYRHD